MINDCSIAFDVYDVSYNQYPVYCRKIGEGLDLKAIPRFDFHTRTYKKNPNKFVENKQVHMMTKYEFKYL